LNRKASSICSQNLEVKKEGKIAFWLGSTLLPDSLLKELNLEVKKNVRSYCQNTTTMYKY
jgi:hypothetical protein